MQFFFFLQYETLQWNIFFRFASFSGTTENGHTKQNKNEDTFSLRQTVNEQRKEIDNLKSQVAAKDKLIKQLEEQVKSYTNTVTLFSPDNNLQLSESIA